MSAQVEFDPDDFVRGLRAAVGRIKVRSEADLQRLGIRVQNNARALCPVDTGRLRASIQHKMGSDSVGPFVEIGSNVEYASEVEFGTQRQRPQPYLRPGLLAGIRGGLR